MNLSVLGLLNTSMKSISSLDVKADNLIKFRNYFFQKVMGSLTIKDLNLALRGLKTLDNYPFVKTETINIINLGDKKVQVKFEFVDMLGSPYTQAKSIKVSLIGPSPQSNVIDASKFVTKDKNVVTL